MCRGRTGTASVCRSWRRPGWRRRPSRGRSSARRSCGRWPGAGRGRVPPGRPAGAEGPRRAAGSRVRSRGHRLRCGLRRRPSWWDAAGELGALGTPGERAARGRVARCWWRASRGSARPAFSRSSPTSSAPTAARSGGGRPTKARAEPMDRSRRCSMTCAGDRPVGAATQLGANAGLVARVAPRCATCWATSPNRSPLSPETNGTALVDAVAQFAAAVSAAAPLLVVVDDAQWADAATVGWLRTLMRQAARRRCWWSSPTGKSTLTVVIRWPTCWRVAARPVDPSGRADGVSTATAWASCWWPGRPGRAGRVRWRRSPRDRRQPVLRARGDPPSGGGRARPPRGRPLGHRPGASWGSRKASGR